MISASIKFSILAAGVIILNIMSPLQGYAVEEFISSVKLQNASIKEVSTLLQTKYGWNVVLNDEKDDIYRNPVITLDFNQVPVWVLVRYSCMAANLKYRFDDDTIIIGRDVERAYRASDYKRKSKLDNIPFGTRMFVGTVYYLPVNYTPPQIVVSNNGNTITYKSSMPIFQQFGSGFSMDSQSEPPPAVLQNEPKKRPPEIADELTGAQFQPMLNALYDMKISVDLEQATLNDAVDAIHKLSIKADPKKVGVNFFIKPFSGVDDVRIDLVLTKMSIPRVLKYICESANLKYHAAPYVIVIYRPGTN